MMNRDLQFLDEALTLLKSDFGSFPDTIDHVDTERFADVLSSVARRMHNNYPYFQDNYAGQMLKPPHAIARLAYMLAMYINPNNHALDGSRASSPMEKEAVQTIAAMFSWHHALGHLTSGGTMANLEALWIAGQIHPDKIIVGSEMAHYTHGRISHVLKIPYKSISADSCGRMHIAALEEMLAKEDVGTVVVTMGTTGSGSVDPLADILALQKKYDFRIHIDAAYGGYFSLASNLHNETKNHFQQIKEADSIVIDPHKHGLQPYGCGCVLFKDTNVAKYYLHDSPYTYYSSDELHLGEISLECSRAGAAAVALWATLQYYPLKHGGAFAQGLEGSHRAAQKLYKYIETSDEFIGLFQPELDIVVWAPHCQKLSQISDLSQQLFDRAADKNLHLALYQYPTRLLPATWNAIEKDADHVTCLRSTLMKPSHEEYIDTLWATLMSCLQDDNIS